MSLRLTKKERKRIIIQNHSFCQKHVSSLKLLYRKVCRKNHGGNVSWRGWKDVTFLLRVPKKWTGPDNEKMNVMSEHFSSGRSGKRKKNMTSMWGRHIASDTRINTSLNEFFTTTQNDGVWMKHTVSLARLMRGWVHALSVYSALTKPAWCVTGTLEKCELKSYATQGNMGKYQMKARSHITVSTEQTKWKELGDGESPTVVQKAQSKS